MILKKPRINNDGIFQKNIVCLLKYGLLFYSLFVFTTARAQTFSAKFFSDSVYQLEKSETLTDSAKRKKFYYLKDAFEKERLPKDSVYARILHRIGECEFNVTKKYRLALDFTLKAIKVNSTAINGSKSFMVNGFYNVAYFYDYLHLYREAIAYYDSTKTAAARLQNFNDPSGILPDVDINLAVILFIGGDYQKAIEESSIGINSSVIKKDTSHLLNFTIQRAQAYIFQNQTEKAYPDAQTAILLAKKINKPFQLASAYKIQGYIYAARRDFASAKINFKKAIEQRLLTDNYDQIIGDYNDFGAFYADSLNDYINAKKYYFKGLDYASKHPDPVEYARICVNLANVFLSGKDYANAVKFNVNAFNHLQLNKGNSLLLNPRYQQIQLTGNNELLFSLFTGKVRLLLTLYKQYRTGKYLTAALQTARLIDSIVTQTRHEQLGEQSKLYWRDFTREFYTNVIEACYMAHNDSLAFYFMEKSRAVLLNDKLNELNAAAQLPPNEAAKEDSLKVNIIEQQQTLNELAENAPGYVTEQNILLNAKADFESYTKSLEAQYPVYYQYKYADYVPSLKALQTFLGNQQQSFVHYFISDSVCYILGITAGGTKFIKLDAKTFNANTLTHFVQLCSDKNELLNYPGVFLNASNTLFRQLFMPLQLPKGRVIICADNFLIPFEALCSDTSFKSFLLYNYTFSYVYAARYLLMKPLMESTAQGDFLGIAPGVFNDNLKLPALSRSVEALKLSAAHYNSYNLWVGDAATHQNFIEQAPHYTIVNVFSHARADSANEPLLFMKDSAVHLYELALLSRPATKLVVLSACQTNVGKNAAGEGIYSLARGFAAAGIPSVAATLWRADEETIYLVSEKFHENLSKGMAKDSALREAKLFFINTSEGEKLLPYYWANMVVVGDVQPVHLTAVAKHPVYVWLTAAVLALLLFYIIAITIKKRKQRNRSPL